MDKAAVYAFLRAKGIAFEVTEHAPLANMEAMFAAGLPYPDAIAKNLFVRGDGKKDYYLITAREERVIDLKLFRQQFCTKRLSFASEVDLAAVLQLTKGSVTPFGLLNNTQHRVHFFLDDYFQNRLIGVHPNENTATVWLNSSDLISLVRERAASVTLF